MDRRRNPDGATDRPRQNRELLARTSDSFNALAKQLESTNAQRIAVLITLLVIEAKTQQIQPGILLSDLSDMLMKGSN